MRYTLAKTEDLKEGKAKAYTLSLKHRSLELFVVHYDGKFYAYENHCPHTGINLNWQPDQFLDITGHRIQCATHGALFHIDSGLCEWGPCLGKQLRPLNIKIQDDELILILNDTDVEQTTYSRQT